MDKASYRQLKVWQKSIELVKIIYNMSAQLPESEKYGLVSQIRRAVVSVPSNIAEGYGRAHRKEYAHHVSIARGSLCEVETLLIVAVEINMYSREQAKEIWASMQEIGKMLNSLLNRLREG